jgi:hypothetical protein
MAETTEIVQTLGSLPAMAVMSVIKAWAGLMAVALVAYFLIDRG